MKRHLRLYEFRLPRIERIYIARDFANQQLSERIYRAFPFIFTALANWAIQDPQLGCKRVSFLPRNKRIRSIAHSLSRSDKRTYLVLLSECLHSLALPIEFLQSLSAPQRCLPFPDAPIAKSASAARCIKPIKPGKRTKRRKRSTSSPKPR